MTSLAKLFKLILRGFVLLIGAWMVFGGGMCALSSILNFRLSGGYAFMLPLSLGLGLVMVWIGWKLLEYGGVEFSVKFGKKKDQGKDGE
jgi:hypothetical protein